VNEPLATEELLARLRAASIEPDPADLPGIEGAYRFYRRAMDRLYAVEGVRYETPALTFDPTPPRPTWEGEPGDVSP
jgi:hypothetical protein